SPIDGSASSSSALPQALCAAAISRSRSCVSQVNPSPIVCQMTRSPNAANASFSPVCQPPLMNCTTPTRLPWPSILNASPNAAVVFPLPGPVLTIRSPFSIVLPATSASCTALRLAILALWRSASFVSVISFHLHWHAGDHEDHLVGRCRNLLIEPPGLVAEAPGQCVVGYDAETHLVGHDHPRSAR